MRKGIIFETQSIDPEVFTRVAGAKKTVMVAVHEWDYGVKLFTAKEWRKRAYDNAEFRRNAEEVADAVMEAVKPELVRDSREVILYAMIRGDDPFLSSILLSSKFLPKFKKNPRGIRAGGDSRSTAYLRFSRFRKDSGRVRGSSG